MTKMDTRLGLCLVENKGLEVQRKEDKYLEKPSFGDKKKSKKKSLVCEWGQSPKEKETNKESF